MKATIKNPQENGKHYGGNKEMISAYNVVTISKGEIKSPVIVRCYMGKSSRASVVYASVWCNGKVWCAGHGSAGGYGYHKESAAVQAAFESAGFSFNHDFGGAGEYEMKDAMKAAARAIGFRGKLEVISS